MRSLYLKIRKTWAGLSLTQKINALFLLYACGLFPLLGGEYTGITLRKTLLILIPSLLWAGALLLAKEKPRLFPLGGVEWALGGFWLWAGVAALCSPFGWSAFLGVGRSGGWLGLSFFLLLWWLGRAWGKGYPKLWLTALAGSLLLMNGVGICQLLGFNPLGLYPPGVGYQDGDILYRGTFLTTIGNTGQLSAFYCLAFPLLLFSWPKERTPLRYLWLLAILSTLPILYLAKLDAAWLGLGLGLPLVFALSRKEKKIRWLSLAVYGLLLCGGLLWLWQYSGENVTLQEASFLLHGQWDPSFGSQRLGVWANTWQMIQERPWLGFGPDCFALAYADHFPGGANWDAAHNEYLGYWCDLGLPGLLTYVSALLLSFVTFLRQQQTAGAAMLLCYGLQGLFSFPTFLVAPLFWLCWGILWGESAERGENFLVSHEKAWYSKIEARE